MNTSKQNIPLHASERSILLQTWTVLCFLFGISIFTSKSGMSILGGILILISPTLISLKELKSKPVVALIATLYPIALIISSFSLTGFEATKIILSGWVWPLISLPAFVIYKNPSLRKSFFIGSCTGILIGCLYSLYLFLTKYNTTFTAAVRVESFWDIGRWGTFLAVATVAMASQFRSVFTSKKTMLYKVCFSLLLLLSTFCLILSNTRAPWMGALIGLFFLVILKTRVRYSILIYLAVVIAIVFATPAIKERFESIFKINKNENGKISSTDPSNAGRLHMWKVAFDLFKENPIFGVGFENTEKPLKEFLSRQTQEYRDSYTTIEYSYRDQHSSYISFLVQMGIIFSALIWILSAYLFLQNLNKYLKNNFRGSLLPAAVLVCFFIEFVFYSSLNTFESTLFFMALTWAYLEKFELDAKQKLN